MLRIGDNPAEVGVARELLNVGTGQWVAEQSLGEENNES